MDGIFNIDKPQGLTSHDVVARVRRISGQRKVGHAGTLDPMATGVLPVVLGKATRLVEYLADANKAYRAVVLLGATSDTYDREGVITPTPGATMPSREQVEQTLHQFRGAIAQLPPMHSAIKVGGKKLYELARAGIEVERQPRPVTITRLDIEAYNPPTLQIFVECSKGTYIRSLAYDIGTSFGTGAYLDALTRTRHGSFSIEGAITLDAFETAFRENTWQESLYPPDYILRGWQTYTTTPEEELAVRQGKSLGLPVSLGGEGGLLAARASDGELLAVLYWDGESGVWRPRKVFSNATPVVVNRPQTTVKIDPQSEMSEEEAQYFWLLDAGELIEILKDKQHRGRGIAMNKLARLGEKRAIDPFISIAKNTEEKEHLREWAIQVLGEFSAVDGVEPLIRLLGSRDRKIRNSAAKSLAAIGDSRAVEPLIKVLSHPDGKTRRATIAALGELRDKRAVEPLIELARNKELGWAVRANAVYSLGLIGGAIAFDAVTGILEASDEHEKVRENAVRALGQLGDERAVRLLLSIAEVDGNEPELRCLALQALSTLKVTSGFELCLGLLNNVEEEARVRECAITVLGEEGRTEAVAAIIAELASENIGIKWAAISALGRLKDKRAVEPLVALLQEQEIEVQIYTVQALGEIGDRRAIEPLRARLYDETGTLNIQVLIALTQLGDSSLYDLLLSLLDSNSMYIRGSALKGLGYLGDVRALNHLLTALEDEDHDIRGYAAQALGRVGDPVALPALIATRKRLLDGSERSWAVEEIGHAIEVLNHIESQQST